MADPSASVFIPPPTVSALLAPTSKPSHLQRPADEETASLKRMQRSLEERLQTLLDTQSAALSAGIEQGEERHADSSSVHDARHGILEAVHELSEIKAAELQQVRTTAENADDLLRQTSGWQEQKHGLEDEIGSRANGASDKELAALDEEEQMIQEQINAIEEKLSELRLRQTNLHARRKQVRNAKASELASFEASLSIVNRDIQQFLRGPLPNALLQDGTSSSLRSLPPRRRTLDMVVDELQEARRSFTAAGDQLAVECDALAEGEEIWAEALRAIEAFESQLKSATRELMSKYPAPSTTVTLADAPNGADSQHGPTQLSKRLHETLDTLRDLFRHAEERGWTLMIAAVSNAYTLLDSPKQSSTDSSIIQIGAEVEAFEKGEQILKQTFPLPDENESASSSAPPDTEIHDPENLLLSRPEE